MKKFKGFTNQQTHTLLKEMGYTGPAQKDDMDAFLASSPSAASKLGRYADIARQRIEGGPLAPTGFAEGGMQSKEIEPTYVNGTMISTNPNQLLGESDEDYANRMRFLKDNSRKPGRKDGEYGPPLGDYTGDQQEDQPEGGLQLGVVQMPGESDEDYAYRSGLKNRPRDTNKKTLEENIESTFGYKPVSRIKDTDKGRIPLDEIDKEPRIPTLPPPDPAFENMSESEREQLRAYFQESSEARKRLFEKALEELGFSTAPDSRNNPEGHKKFFSLFQNLLDNDPEYNAADSKISDFKKSIIDRYNLQQEDQPDDTQEAFQPGPVLKKGTPSPEVSEAATALDEAQKAYSTAMGALTDAQLALSGATIPADNAPQEEKDAYEALQKAVEDAELSVTQTQAAVSTAQKRFETTDVPSTGEALGKAISTPSAILAQPTVYGLEVQDDQIIDSTTGKVADALTLLVKQAQAADNVENPVFKKSKAYLQGLTPEERNDKYPPFTPKAEPYTSVEDGTPEERKAAGTSLSTKVLRHVTGLGELTPEDIAKYDVDGDGQLTVDDSNQYLRMATGLQDPNEAFKDFFLNKYPSRTMPPEEIEKARDDYYAAQQTQIEQDAVKSTTETYDAIESNAAVKSALADFAAATGSPSDEALMDAATMDPEELAQLDLDPATLDTIREVTQVVRSLQDGEQPDAALFDKYTTAPDVTFEGEVEEIDPAKFEDETPEIKPEVDYNLPPSQIAEVEKSKVEDAANFGDYATAPEKKSEFVPDVTAEQTTVSDDELADVNDILNGEEIIVTAKTLEALNEASTAKAATATFTQQLEAKAVKGDVSAASTVSYQMEKLMKQFDDGTPPWAAGALRKANAAMAARGLAGSSMAGAAIVQAAMEASIPMAQADAATYAAMDMENVRNAQAVALANAAAAQNFELANLSNEQAVRIQNSMNNANLQLKNLSNEQEAVLAQAQFKAALQGQELSISANVALANAARYAAVNDINLTNRQQTSILKSTQNLEVEMANLSNAQQTALSNLQVKAAMMGQELSNEQQMAVLESTQAFEANMQDATNRQQAFIQDAVARAAMEGRVLDNKQQTALFNISNVMSEREIELNNEQQTAIFNMSNKMTIDMANLSNRQQTALANAQIEAAMKGQELTNKQQVAVIKAERVAEIANMNFTESQTRALRNSEMAMSVDLANLSNEQAKLMADCAALTDVDMANLNNRQQAQAQQAQAFLQMDMANLDNEQQAVMFEAQSLVQSIFSDQAAQNAQLQFNAESINQVNQFYESMATQISQFNVAQSNAMEQFNAGEENTMTKFQAELDNQRDLFNAQNELVIAQANTVWRQTVATANTAALNEANMAEVMAQNNLTLTGLAELWQQERDLMDFAWRSANNQLQRDHELLVQKIANDNAEDSARGKAAGNLVSSLFNAALDIGKAYIQSKI